MHIHSTASKSHINATLRGGLRTGIHRVAPAPVTIYVPPAGQYHFPSAGTQALDTLAAKRAASGEAAPGTAPTALGATLAACRARAAHVAELRARAAAGLPPPRKPRRKSAGAMAASPRSAQARANDAQYGRARRALERYATDHGCRLVTEASRTEKTVWAMIVDSDGQPLISRASDKGKTIHKLLNDMCRALKLEV